MEPAQHIENTDADKRRWRNRLAELQAEEAARDPLADAFKTPEARQERERRVVLLAAVKRNAKKEAWAEKRALQRAARLARWERERLKRARKAEQVRANKEARAALEAQRAVRREAREARRAELAKKRLKFLARKAELVLLRAEAARKREERKARKEERARRSKAWHERRAWLREHKEQALEARAKARELRRAHREALEENARRDRKRRDQEFNKRIRAGMKAQAERSILSALRAERRKLLARERMTLKRMMDVPVKEPGWEARISAQQRKVEALRVRVKKTDLLKDTVAKLVDQEFRDRLERAAPVDLDPATAVTLRKKPRMPKGMKKALKLMKKPADKDKDGDVKEMPVPGAVPVQNTPQAEQVLAGPDPLDALL